MERNDGKKYEPAIVIVDGCWLIVVGQQQTSNHQPSTNNQN